MIIKRETKHPLTRSDKPNENWTGDDETYFLVNDDTELGQKLLANAPYYDEILDNEGNLIDITLTERPPEPILAPSIEERTSFLEDVVMLMMIPPMP